MGKKSKHTIKGYGMSSPVVFKFSRSVLRLVILKVCLLTFFAALVVFVQHSTNINVTIPNSIMQPFTLVVGFMIVFRTNSAYARYTEGSDTWYKIKSSIRNLARSLCLIESESEEQKQEQKEALKSLIAYCFSTMRFLRNECENNLDLFGLIAKELQSHLSEENLLDVSCHQTENTNIEPQLRPLISSEAPNRVTKTPTFSSELHKNIEQGQWYQRISKNRNKSRKRNRNSKFHTYLPIEIIYHLSKFVDKVYKQKRIDAQTNISFGNTLYGLTDYFGILEKLVETPVPLSYEIHLKQVLYLYCVALPFTILGVDYRSVVLVFFVSFTLFGIDMIASEIENPFGYDEDDLLLDEICYDVVFEVESFLNKL